VVDMSGDPTLITPAELERIKRQAVMESKVDGMEKMLPEIFGSLKALNKSVDKIPLEIVNCRDDLERDIKTYTHNGFVTGAELKTFETKLEGKMNSSFHSLNAKISRGGWILSGFIAASSVFSFLLTKTSLFQ